MLKNVSCRNVNLRNHHHGVVCTRCNRERIEPLIVPESLKAYRTMAFYVENGFHTSDGWRRNRTWSDFNSCPPPYLMIEQDFMKPWSPEQPVEITTINAPNPYCSCGYYSIKNLVFEVTTGSFLTWTKKFS